jgi:pilus assembly protein CpaB
MRAYTIGVTEVSGVGGHAMPGDRVDVVLTRDLTSNSGPPAAGRKLISTVVVQNVRVLGVGLNVNPTSTEPAVSTSATLEVSVQDAEKLAVAAQAGGLSLALRRTGAEDVTPIKPVLVSDLTPGGLSSGEPALRGARLSVRHGGRRHSAFGAGPASAGSAVTIVNGEASSRVSVPIDPMGAGA